MQIIYAISGITSRPYHFIMVGPSPSPEGHETEKGEERIFEEITAEKFSNLGKETDIEVQEAEF